MPIIKNGFEWYTPSEIMLLISNAPNEPIRLTTEGWELNAVQRLRTRGLNQQGSMGYYLVVNTLDMAPYWRFADGEPPSTFVIREQVSFNGKKA